MNDAELRALERRAAQGDPQAEAELAQARERLDPRDPRLDPMPGDVVQVCTPSGWWTRRVVLHAPSERAAEIAASWGRLPVWFAHGVWTSRRGSRTVETRLIPKRGNVVGLRSASARYSHGVWTPEDDQPASTWRGEIVGLSWGRSPWAVRGDIPDVTPRASWRRWARDGEVLRRAPPDDPRRYFHGRVLRTYPPGAPDPTPF